MEHFRNPDPWEAEQEDCGEFQDHIECQTSLGCTSSPVLKQTNQEAHLVPERQVEVFVSVKLTSKAP